MRSTALRRSPPSLLGRVYTAREKALPHRSEAETALIEAYDLACAYPGELAHLLAGIRAGLYAAGVGRKTS